MPNRCYLPCAPGPDVGSGHHKAEPRTPSGSGTRTCHSDAAIVRARGEGGYTNLDLKAEQYLSIQHPVRDVSGFLNGETTPAILRWKAITPSLSHL